MTQINISIAAATAVVGVDLLADQPGAVSNVPRRINYIGLAGSAAALDTQIRLMAGTTQLANPFNSSLGAVTRDDRFALTGATLPAGTRLYAIVTDAPATNPINFTVDL